MDISSPIKHETLDGILPQSENEDIKYTKSIIPNNDHVQYIHREGYNPEMKAAMETLCLETCLYRQLIARRYLTTRSMIQTRYYLEKPTEMAIVYIDVQ